jgi:hypothetical protein
VGGQSTNCKINAAILRSARVGSRIDLYFLKTPDRHNIERTLIAERRGGHHPPA